jgi:hypothetical protein
MNRWFYQTGANAAVSRVPVAVVAIHTGSYFTSWVRTCHTCQPVSNINSYWNELKTQRDFFEWIKEQHDIRATEDWYRMAKVIKPKVEFLLQQYHSNSLAKGRQTHSQSYCCIVALLHCCIDVDADYVNSSMYFISG